MKKADEAKQSNVMAAIEAVEDLEVLKECGVDDMVISGVDPTTVLNR